ncbi:MAG: hypothetical protein B6D41_13740, partial [Chloroflexi bacterium UTCFX4]
MNDFLRAIPLFSGLDDYALERLVAMSEQLELKPGDYLIREGEIGDSMYIVVTGKFQIRKKAGDAEVVLAERGA